LELSIETILLYSPSLPLNDVAAMAISSPATQSTASLNLMMVAPGWTV